jgi:probable HAF family extracellular repeat protein
MPAMSAPFYEIFQLGTLGGDTTTGVAINELGQVTGESRTSANIDHAFIGDQSGLIDIGTLIGSSGDSSGRDINDLGQVTGRSTSVTGFNHAFVGGVQGLTDLGTLGSGVFSGGGGINNNGVVAGTSLTINQTTPRAFISGVSGLFDLGASNFGLNPSSSATGINDSGLVVGTDGDRAFIGDVNGRIDIGGTEHSSFSRGRAINNAGQITGEHGIDGQRHAFIGDVVNGITDLGTLGGNKSIGLGINDFGQVVGESRFSGGGIREHAFLYDLIVGMIDINDLIDPNDELFGLVTLSDARDINNSGQIIANGFLAGGTGDRLAFILNPIAGTEFVPVSNPEAPSPEGDPNSIPEPMSLALFLFGAFGLFVRKQRT